SEVTAGPRPERRKPLPAPQPEPEPQPEPQPEPEANQEADTEAEAEEAPGSLMELMVVFDGGSRGNPGQGYGSFRVQQAPNGKPITKRVEFGDNYTNNQAEYDTLIECLIFIIERLESTNRSPKQVQLDIKT